jgi:hypothetical protein
LAAGGGGERVVLTDPEDFYESIANDVLAVLVRKRYFEFLDARLCPPDGSRAEKCAHDHALSIALLIELGFNDADREDILGVLQSKGGCCDCEILYNVAPESRLRERYWKAQAKRLESHD